MEWDIELEICNYMLAELDRDDADHDDDKTGER